MDDVKVYADSLNERIEYRAAGSTKDEHKYYEDTCIEYANIISALSSKDSDLTLKDLLRLRIFFTFMRKNI